jgi:hypothetical protein
MFGVVLVVCAVVKGMMSLMMPATAGDCDMASQGKEI